ncbi:Histidinol-phosphate aminotransferase [wastewater metagenome]|uniref:Histidinol-phosphate aminotransferase n=2 Tax=unclassified sequences TaxID=12908 RepID=A0A5B8RIN2_9ZZZZ|nr:MULTISPECIES: PLP-dependent aminotransferase family protein [Arhodomonas]MCS4503338.1 PLP-dependent aminotransferase family protein [Arhodomonas aquaeolei]QEA07562.1 histidinol-phosphate aminotransferase [uncultured organism]
MSDYLYERVAAGIQTQIEQGTYAPGERLPGVRKLRRQYGVSVATAVAACELLEQREILEARPRSGFYVRGRARHATAPPEVSAEETPGPSLVSGQERVLELVQAHHDPDLMSLGAAVPDAGFLPGAALDRSFARVRRRARRRIAGYDFPPGSSELRVQVARRMADAGCSTGPDELVVTSGCQEALVLSLRAVANPGEVVAIESPTFYGILQAIESLGMRALEIATDPADGMIPDALAHALRTWPIRACVMMPSFGNPLGHLAPPARKAALVALLREHGVPLIEDDVYGELAFNSVRPWAAKAYDEDGDVLYCSSFSKTLGAGLRVGWVAPGRYRDRVMYLKYAGSQASPTVTTLAVADYLEQGGYERHLRRARRRYERQVRRFVDAIGRHFPEGTRVTRPRGGFVIWVQLPRSTDAVILQQRARAVGISIAAGPIFSSSGRYRDCLRLNCAHPWTDTVADAVARLGTIARELHREGIS